LHEKGLASFGDGNLQSGHNRALAGWTANISMYQKHFGLTERPFSIAPDPRFLYMSQQHREALAHLLYGVGEGGGFVQLTGEVGTGKTTICRCLLEQLPEHVDLALILNPRVTAQELLASLCDELNIQYARDTTSIKVLTDVLNAYLLDSHARGRRTVLMIDEAQNLSAEALEQVRLLTNLETTREKLLQIILVGQPELRTLLARDDLRQLSQRITARYHLDPIDLKDTMSYIRHRLQVCGASDQIFSQAAIELIHKLSTGVPRLINVLCDRAMLGAFVEGKRQIEVPIVRKAASEVLPEEGLYAPVNRWRWFLGLAALLALAAAGYVLTPSLFSGLGPEPVAATAPMLTKPSPISRSGHARASASLATVDAVAPGETASTEVLPLAEPETVSVGAGIYTASDKLEQALAQAGPDAAANAWTALYRLWGVSASVHSDEQACAQAPGVGLRCLQGGGSWTVLEQLDRPAILLLLTQEGKRVPVVLLEVLGSNTRLQVDGKQLLVPSKLLEGSWLGHYRMLWKTPPNGSAVLRSGDRGADVHWLREEMQQATGLTSIAPNPAVFDASLKELVQNFQRDHGLEADGVAGARTLIYLNNMKRQPAVPRLGVVKG
jgi:general secretion pathway protein A